MDVQKKQLKNGLVIVSEAMPHLHSVSLGVWIRSGSRSESACGLAHFVEHMLFKGTGNRSAGDIARAVDEVGGQLDAFTDKECVGIYARVRDRHLALAFEIVADILLHAAFPPAELRRERNVILEEISTIEDSPAELVHDLFLETCWPGHPLGRPVSGTRESVAGIRRGDLIRHFRTYYSACNMVVSVAGNVRHEQVLRLTRRFFPHLAPGEKGAPGSAPDFRAARVVRRKKNLEQVHLCIGFPCPPIVSDERFATHVLNNVLGGGMSSRLFQNLREKRGLVYAIDSNLNLFRDAGTLVVCAATSPGAAARVVDLTLEEFKRLKRRRLSAEELKRAKEFIKGSMILSMESSSSRMTQLAQQEIDFGRFFTLEETMGRLDRVEAADVLRLANGIFDPSLLVLTALGRNGARDLESVDLTV